MDYKHSCVIDANFIYKTFVLVILAESEEKPQYYELQEGEQLIDTAPPVVRPHAGAAGFVRPRWDADTSTWVEAATGDEITAWEEEHPDPNAKTLEELRAARQEENKAALAAWLAAHPLTWTDGKRYGVEEQDQNEMALNLMQYQAAASAGQVAPLEWHAQKEACRDFT